MFAQHIAREASGAIPHAMDSVCSSAHGAGAHPAPDLECELCLLCAPCQVPALVCQPGSPLNSDWLTNSDARRTEGRCGAFAGYPWRHPGSCPQCGVALRGRRGLPVQAGRSEAPHDTARGGELAWKQFHQSCRDLPTPAGGRPGRGRPFYATGFVVALLPGIGHLPEVRHRLWVRSHLRGVLLPLPEATAQACASGKG